MSRLKIWLLLRLLQQFYMELCRDKKFLAADDVLEVMDSVSGWTTDLRRLT